MSKHTHNRPMTYALATSLEAINLLAQLGASDALLGHAYRELVTTPNKPFERGANTTTKHEFSKSDSLDTDKGQKAAVSTQLPASGVASGGAAFLALGTKAEIVVFKDSLGQRSSVSFPASDWSEMLQASRGTAESLRSRVREVAARAPLGENRSRWTRAEMTSQEKGRETNALP